LAAKFDLGKAYDRINLDILKSTLKDFGLLTGTVKLIMFCVQFFSVSLLWNGLKLPVFSPTRELRQGDPLSPYLFVMCMEKLACLFNKKVSDKTWLPIHVSKGGPSISHLLFADDVLLFTKATKAQMRMLVSVLIAFCSASGLKVNFDKSRVMCSNNVSRRVKHDLSQISNIKFASNLGMYPGFRLIHGRVKKVDLNFIMESIQSKLAAWKGRLLNKAGRVTLAKLVLAAIPTYFMQQIWLPHSVCLGINKMVRNFI
jgi:hypothetical protein